MSRVPHFSPQWHAEHAERLARIPPGEDERFVGYAILGLRFESGHVLALRRWPASSVGDAYTSVWHQSPDGRWHLYANIAREQSCARYIDSATAEFVEGAIRLVWEDPYRLRVNVCRAGLEWQIDFRRSWITRAFSAARLVLPDVLLAPRALRAMDWIAGERLKVRTMHLSGVMPNGNAYRSLPRHVWLMEDARAWLNGVALGAPERSSSGAQIGSLTVSTSGVLAFVTARFAPRIAPAQSDSDQFANIQPVTGAVVPSDQVTVPVPD